MAPREEEDDLDLDLEAGLDEEDDSLKEELPGSSRPRNFFGLKKTLTGLSDASKQSRQSMFSKPIKLAKRLSSLSHHEPGPSQSQPLHSERKLMSFLLDGQKATDSFVDASQWFTKFIDRNYKTFWPFIQPHVKDLSGDTAAPNQADFVKIDQVLKATAEHLLTMKNLALVTVVDELVNDGLLRDDTYDRQALLQLVFLFLGWLSLLYNPQPPKEPTKLQIAKTATTSSGEQVQLRKRPFDDYSQNLNEYKDQPLYLLLGIFGNIIPDPPPRKRQDAPTSERIKVPYVCYHTLRKVCKVEIQWFDTLGMHLEFDSSQKILKMFRFPSFCRLMYRHKKRGLLSKLFGDNERYITSDFTLDDVPTGDFFRELLLTYRLIFGQNAKSWQLFASEMASQAHRSSTTISKGNGSHSHPGGILHLEDADPMLAKLCGRRHDAIGSADIYEEIHADNVQTYYMPSSFPFFASRILSLQDYTREQHPHDWKTLWHDHRDKSNWWQFWAVLFIGGGTIVIGTLSLVFQIGQLVIAQEQLIQQSGNSVPFSGCSCVTGAQAPLASNI